VYYIVTSAKTFERAAADLDAAVKRNGFGVLHVHDLGGTLRGKGLDFGNECRVFEVCNPAQAAKVLGADMRLNMALPCRICVYTESGRTHIGLIRPVPMLAALSDDPALRSVAAEVEAATICMVDEAR
jgi:uncharacterized protein (DUF302 family)